MYYQEKIIKGRLYYKGTPNGKWRLVPILEVTRRLQEATKQVKILKEEKEFILDRESGIR